METNVHFVLKKREDEIFRSVNYDAKLLKEGERIEKGDKVYFFFKIEKMLLGETVFPISINTSKENEFVEFALLCKDSNFREQIKVKYLYDRLIMLSEKDETTSSIESFLYLIESIINISLEEIKKKNEVKYVIYPSFDIDGYNIVFAYKEYIVNDQCIDSEKYYLGFNKCFFNLIMRYFLCDFVEDRVTHKIFYVLYDGGYDGNYTAFSDKIVFAHHSLEDFFYPERRLYIETSREDKPKFNDTEKSYKSEIIYFRNEHDVIDINKYLLVGSHNTLTENATPKHYIRFKMKIDPNFPPLKDNVITVIGKFIRYNDIHDNMSLFNVTPGSLYSETEYNEMTFRKLITLHADNVHINNDSVTEQLKILNNHLSAQFPLLKSTTENNIPLLIKNIYDTVNQTQLIRPLGPSLKEPGNKKAKIDLPIPGT